MYSRYSNIKLPQNYSGSRFSVETETKLHKPPELTGIKNAHSPSFVTSIKKESINERDDDFIDEDNDEISYEEDYFENTYDESSSSNEPQEIEASVPAQKSVRGGFDLSLIKGIFDKISSEDLLILGVILLIATDSSGISDSAIWILALLLLARD